MKRLSGVLVVALSWSCGEAPPADDTPATGQTAEAAMAVPSCFVQGDPAGLGERPSPLDSVMIDLGDHVLLPGLIYLLGMGTQQAVLNSLVIQNRAVGLISHVPLVQEAIPNGFYVRKGLAGSRVEVRGLM